MRGINRHEAEDESSWNMHSRTMSFAVERTLSSGTAGMRFVEAWGVI